MKTPMALFLGLVAVALAILFARQQETVSQARLTPDYSIVKTENGNLWRMNLASGQVSLCIPAADGSGEGEPVCGPWSVPDGTVVEAPDKDAEYYRP